MRYTLIDYCRRHFTKVFGTMTSNDEIQNHYSHGSLLDQIRDGLTKKGITPEEVTIDDLGPVDEFHIGGRAATAHFLDQLGMTASHRVLDIGCGLGGPARFVAQTYGAQVVGIDLTQEYVETGRVLNDWVGLSDRVELHHGSAMSLPIEDGVLDGAYMMHVGMNIEDKAGLFAEVARVLKPGAPFGVFDVMTTNDEALVFPVPWSTTPDTSWVETPDVYRQAFEASGFDVTTEANRHDFAMAFFAKLRAAQEAADGPPPLGLHLVMQKSTGVKIPNMVANLAAGRIAPIEMIAIKR